MSLSREKSFKKFCEFDSALRKYPKYDGRLFVKPSKGNWRERFEIYATGYEARSHESLAEIYELLAKIVPGKKWYALVEDYGRKFQSRSPNIGDIGNDLPRYLKKIKAPQVWVDLAEFELAVWRTFHAFLAPSKITQERFAQITNESRFKVQEVLQFFSWKKFQLASSWFDRDGLKKLKRGKEFAYIYRHNENVMVAACEESEWQLLRSLASGKTLGRSIEALKKPMMPEQLSQHLGLWLVRGILTDFS